MADSLEVKLMLISSEKLNFLSPETETETIIISSMNISYCISHVKGLTEVTRFHI